MKKIITFVMCLALIALFVFWISMPVITATENGWKYDYKFGIDNVPIVSDLMKFFSKGGLQQKCADGHGQLHGLEMAIGPRIQECLYPYADGGRSCNDTSQCMGICEWLGGLKDIHLIESIYLKNEVHKYSCENGCLGQCSKYPIRTNGSLKETRASHVEQGIILYP
jgi:hypothetical protein